MRFLAWLAVVVPSLVVGLTSLHVTESTDLVQPMPLLVAEVAALSAFTGLNRLVSNLLASRIQNDN
jgi:hypothetical protein